MQGKSDLLRLAHKKPSNTLRKGGGASKNKNNIDLSHLNAIISIDEKNMIADCEGRVTIYELCKATLAYGLIPLVVPEFKSITIAGAIMGSALESSSFLYGQFNDSLLEADFLLGDGTPLTATPEVHSDLFYGVTGSYGSIALLTRAKIKLKKAANYVHLKYKNFNTSSDLFAFFSTAKGDFLEGVMLKDDLFVAIVGTLSEKKEKKAPLSLFSQKYWGANWFIDHIAAHPDEELMPIKDYLFRFDRGGFWIGKTLGDWKLFIRSLLRINLKGIPKYAAKASFSKPMPKLFRFLFGWSFTSVSLYHIWHRVPKKILENLFFIHDFYAPAEKATEILASFQEKTGILPVWLCPIKGVKSEQFLSPHYGKDFFINIGLYGIPKGGSTKELSSLCENEIISRGGRKMLYSYTYYDKEKFSEIYEGQKYKVLREKYGSASRFPSLYEKVKE